MPEHRDEPGPHHHDATETELVAAELSQSGRADFKSRLVRMTREAPDGMNTWELTDALERLVGREVSHDSVKACVNTLMNEGWLLRSTRKRPGRFTREGWVYYAIAEGATPQATGHVRRHNRSQWKPMEDGLAWVACEIIHVGVFQGAPVAMVKLQPNNSPPLTMVVNLDQLAERRH